MTNEFEGLQEEVRILNKFYDFLKKNLNECIIDTIEEFCFEHNLPLEYIGNLISEDPSLKSFTEQNLKRYNYIQTPKIKKQEAW